MILDLKLGENGQIWSNSVEFEQNSRIRPNLTFEFEFRNSKYRNLNEFERIRPSLYSTQINN